VWQSKVSAQVILAIVVSHIFCAFPANVVACRFPLSLCLSNLSFSHIHLLINGRLIVLFMSLFFGIEVLIYCKCFGHVSDCALNEADDKSHIN